ncbi:hypothetical protein ACVWWR_002526 [Bradyrhizobium sp. LM3.2]
MSANLKTLNFPKGLVFLRTSGQVHPFGGMRCPQSPGGRRCAERPAPLWGNRHQTCLFSASVAGVSNEQVHPWAPLQVPRPSVPDPRDQGPLVQGRPLKRRDDPLSVGLCRTQLRADLQSSHDEEPNPQRAVEQALRTPPCTGESRADQEDQEEGSDEAAEEANSRGPPGGSSQAGGQSGRPRRATCPAPLVPRLRDLLRPRSDLRAVLAEQMRRAERA